jgi:hypothetical protein
MDWNRGGSAIGGSFGKRNRVALINDGPQMAERVSVHAENCKVQREGVRSVRSMFSGSDFW